MARDYLPRADVGMLEWMQAFANGIAARPSAYMLAPGQAAMIVQTVGAYAAALAIAKEPTTRTSVTVNQKDAARNSAEELCRRYYTLIKANAGVSDADKIAIGVRPENPSRRRIDCPQSSPLLNVVAATPGRHVLRYHDTNTPASRAKPFGAVQLQLMVVVAPAPGTSAPAPGSSAAGSSTGAGSPPVDGNSGDVGGAAKRARPAQGRSIHVPLGGGELPGGARLVGQFVENPISVAFTAAEDCRKATYYGRWVSRRGETGPWSLPVSMTIAA